MYRHFLSRSLYVLVELSLDEWEVGELRRELGFLCVFAYVSLGYRW